MRQLVKPPLNRILNGLGLRLVNANWGPRGFAASLRRVRRQGVALRQIVDVGASDGKWARECMEIFPEANYLVIDPLEENRAVLERLADEYQNMTVWHGALGEKRGTAPLCLHGDQSSFFSSEYDTGQRKPVEVRPLDSFLGHELAHPPDLIKADVQGFELNVLQGASQCLLTAELLLLEVSFRKVYQEAPLAHDVIGFCGERGFRILEVCSYTQRASDGWLAHADVLFARADSKLFARESYE